MSASVIGGLSNLQAFLQSLAQSQTASSQSTTGAGDAEAPTDALTALFQAFTGGGGASSPTAPGAASASSPGAAPLSSDMLSTLISLQGQPDSLSSLSQSVLSKFDSNGDGQVSQSEFENAIGPNADKSQVDALFNKLDANGDGSVGQDELTSALKSAHHGGHHHHGGAGAAAAGQSGGAGGSGAAGGSGGGDQLLNALTSGTDGATSQTATNADGSSTTTLTYADGTTVSMTIPGATGAENSSGHRSGGGSHGASSQNLMEQLIQLQSQILAPPPSLAVNV